MKYKSLLLSLAFLLLSNFSFADGYGDKIINAPTVYFQLTGNSEIDNILQSAFENYWKVNHVVAIPANAAKKDIEIKEGKAPIFVFINTFSVKTSGYVDCLALIWGNSGTFSKSSFDQDAFLRRVSLFVPADEMNLLNIDFAIPLAIKEMNDELMYYKTNKQAVTTVSSNPSALKDKTLLIPQEFVDKKSTIFPAASLTGYKYKYKIMPTKEIKTIANDSSENSGYCYFTVASYGEIEIFDLTTKELLITDQLKGVGLKIKQSDMQKVSNEIAAAPTPRKKK